VICYQCENEVEYLFDDSRCKDCTRMTPDEVVGATDEHKEFLNELRESGITNMFGAAPYIVDRFNVDRTKAKEILKDWMESFK